MDQPFELAARAGDVWTIDRNLFFVAFDLGSANGALCRHSHLLGRIPRVPPLRNGADYLWNDLAGPLDLDPIARPEILLPDEIEIVKGRELHHSSADLYRLEHGEGVERSGASDIHFDRQQLRLGDVRREFARDCVTGLAGDDSELLPERELVDLHHSAIDREVERRAHLGLERASPFMHLLETRAAQPMRRHWNAPFPEQVEQLRLS